ncbi:MAG TPA: GNAT family N-acetyltransferase [Terriglobales bacterium]|nr:GNAT family N-acetyltransferase [Terriglobales bacterium]
MEFVDQALARRLEAAEEMPQVHYARLYQKLRPEVNAAVEPVCGGHMIFAGVGAMVGRAVGLGFDGPVLAADLDRLEEFYGSRGAPAQVDVCPLTDPGLMELLKERGYRMAELNNVLYCRMDGAGLADSTPAGSKIRSAGPGEAEMFAGIVKHSFFPEGGAPEDFNVTFTPLFQMKGALTFVAEMRGQTVACGAGLIIAEHKVVPLFGAATLPAFRSRGLQTALLRLRMGVAAEAGCDVAVIVTKGGTTSQRNAERLGFRLAYSKATLIKPIPPEQPGQIGIKR